MKRVIVKVSEGTFDASILSAVYQAGSYWYVRFHDETNRVLPVSEESAVKLAQAMEDYNSAQE